MTEHFLTTRWSRVLAAQGHATPGGAALAELCAVYYAPVHVYIERTARDLGDAQDLTQAFFSGLLAGRGLAGAEPDKGRFRAYLLGAVKHFLADERDRRQTVKRGARYEHVSAEDGAAAIPVAPPSDAWFDRQWGLAVLEQALTALAAEHEQRGKGAHFHLLKPWLTGGAEAMSQAEAAAHLGLNEGAVKAAIHRLRKRFRDLVRAEIAQTVSTEEDAGAELRYLIEVVC